MLIAFLLNLIDFLSRVNKYLVVAKEFSVGNFVVHKPNGLFSATAKDQVWEEVSVDENDN